MIVGDSMNKKIIFIIILMFITVNIVFARECTSTFIFEDLEDVSYHAGTTYEMDKGLCRYYDDHPNEMPNELETMLEENQCYVTMYFEEFPKPLTYYNGKMYDFKKFGELDLFYNNIMTELALDNLNG